MSFVTTSLRKKNMGSKTLILFCHLLSMVPLLVSSTQFQVGGDLGWVIPPNNESGLYNAWASKNRFHVGDTIYFKYKKDSVFVVEEEQYQNCDTSEPISKFADGHTVFKLEHFGFYHFISGLPDHCKLGQKMVIRVMVQPKTETETPKASPPPESDDGDVGGHHSWNNDDFGPPGFNATIRLSVTSCFMTAVTVMFIFLYMFM